MAGVARIGLDSINGVPLTAGSPDVNANNVGVVRAGDILPPHPAAPFGTGTHTGSIVTVASASSSVNANGLGVVRGGDVANCGHAIEGGSPDVDAGG